MSLDSLVALYRGGVDNIPMCCHRLSRPHWTRFRRHLIADREDEIHERSIGLSELVPVLAAQPSCRKAIFFQKLNSEWIHAAGRMTARVKGFELTLPTESRIASAIILRAELPVHKNITLKFFLSSIESSSVSRW